MSHEHYYKGTVDPSIKRSGAFPTSGALCAR
jgi:hypothetical protein